MSIALPGQVTISDQVLFQEMGDECVLLNLATETYYGLDEVGARMWHLMTEHSHTETVIQHLRTYYAASEDTLRGDLATLIQSLQTAGLVSVKSD